jgi:hypothetical protein
MSAPQPEAVVAQNLLRLMVRFVFGVKGIG